MLSSNWHVTQRLIVFEISAVKWPKFRPNIWDFGDTLGISPQKETLPVRDRYVPSCKISRLSVSPPTRYLSAHKKYKADLISDKNAALRLSIINPLRCRGNYSATSINMKSVHCMADLLAIPNPSTASVLSPYCYIIVRCYAVLMCPLNG